MQKSLKTIFQEINQEHMSYSEYKLVIEALEIKYSHPLLMESNYNIDDAYYVYIKLENRSKLLEWNKDDFNKFISDVKNKSMEIKDKTMVLASSLIEKFKKSYSVTFDAFLQLGINLKLNINEIFDTLKEKGIWEAIKRIKPLASDTISDLYTGYTTAYKETSDILFGSIDRSKVGEALRAGTLKIQNIIDQNPNLKYIVGPLIAYTLYYIWTKMVFKGDFLYDFDWSTNFSAFLGDFEVEEIFAGENGVELLTWFALGLTDMFPSVVWLDGDLKSIFKGWGNHALAILATIMIFLNEKYPQLLDRPLIKAIKNKLCKRDKKLSLKPKSVNNLKKLGIKKGIYKKCSGPSCN